ncbi:MAG: tetratricopeptide (TPR) repeat protein, partial [Vicingaceae bacterium]
QINKNKVLVKTGNTKKAIKSYKTLVKKQPENPEIYYELAVAQYVKKDYAEAIKSLQSALILAPFQPKYKLLAGKIQYAQKNFFEAINALASTLKINNRLLEAYYYLGLSYAETGKVEDALKQFKLALALQPLYFEAILAQTKTEFEYATTYETYQKLIIQLKKGLKIKPNSLEGNILFADLESARGQRFKAEAILKELLKTYPKHNLVLYSLAKLHFTVGNFKESNEFLSQQTEKDFRSHALQARVLLHQNQLEEGEKVIQDLLKKKPQSSQVYLLLGELYLKKDDLFSAEDKLRKAVLLDWENVEANYLLSKTFARQFNYIEAKREIEKALKQEPANLIYQAQYMNILIKNGQWYLVPTILNSLKITEPIPEILAVKGALALEKGNLQNAHNLYRQAAMSRYSIEYENQLAKIEIKMLQYDLAKTRIDKILAISPKNFQANLSKGKLLFQKDEFKTIPELLLPLLKYQGNLGYANILLAEAYMRLGKTDLAMKTFKKGYEKWKNNPDYILSYTFHLGNLKEYKIAIEILKENLEQKHKYSRLFKLRLAQYYYLSKNYEGYQEYLKQFNWDSF